MQFVGSISDSRKMEEVGSTDGLQNEKTIVANETRIEDKFGSDKAYIGWKIHLQSFGSAFWSRAFGMSLCSGGDSAWKRTASFLLDRGKGGGGASVHQCRLEVLSEPWWIVTHLTAQVRGWTKNNNLMFMNVLWKDKSYSE
ncbi:hypothetical protein KY284_006131 [Solanum tuberosum]|nr:hypothetical protein KY284_006131 [Solanum tuberosum]